MAEDVLASDREREATVLRLRADHLRRRLTVEELEDRVARAHAARTVSELDALRADLPRRHDLAPTDRPGRLWLPGRRAFTQRTVLEADPERAYEQALVTIVPGARRRGVARGPRGPRPAHLL